MSITLLPSPQQRLVHKPYLWLAALQVLDVATTWMVLRWFAEANEANPLVDFLFNTVGLTTGLVALLALKLSVVYTLWVCQTKTKIAIAIYSAVIANNVLFLVLYITS